MNVQRLSRPALSRLLFLLMLYMANGHVYGEIPVRNYNPFALMVGLPELRSAFLLPSGQTALSINTSLSNQWNITSAEGEEIFIDGEVNITDLNFRLGYKRLEFSLNIPLLAYGGGNLDPLIEGFHQALSMPNGGRELFYQNRLLFSYSNTATAQAIRIDEPESGVGDVRIAVATQLKRTDAFASSIGLQLKLANGDTQSWMGSGAYDLALFNNFEWQRGDWQTQIQLGLVFMQQGEFLSGQRESVAGTLGGAINYNMLSSLWWILQYDLHTALFSDSELAVLGSGQMLSSALAWRSKRWQAHIAIVEDVVVESAPDVGFQLGFEYRPPTFTGTGN